MDQQHENQSRDHSLLVAIGFIIVGVIFLLRNIDVIDFGRRWWALFFLIPISYILANIFQHRSQNQGTFPPEARASFIGLISLVTVMVIFLFGLHWGTMWPVFIIIGGISMMLKFRK